MDLHDSSDGATREEPPPIDKPIDDGKPKANSVAARIAKAVVQLAGIAVFAVTAWQAAGHLRFLLRNPESSASWFWFAVHFSIWTPCWIGSIALLLGKYNGILFFGLAGIFHLIGRIPDLTVWTWVLIVSVFPMIMSLSWLIDYYYPPVASRRPVLFRVGLGLLILLFDVTFIAQNIHRSDAPRMILDGNAAYQTGRDDEAIANWSHVIDHSLPGSTNWAIAVFNTGIAHREHDRYTEAIAIFTLLLKSDAHDAEYELDANGNFNLMTPYRNYHHRACLQIADCHEKLGDRASTVQYLLLARDKYPYESFSGTSMMHIRQALDKRIKALEQPGENAQ